jgi:hypothetical protein
MCYNLFGGNMNKYIVKYFLGSRMAELYIEAHTEEQAGSIAEIQAHHRHSSRAKFEVISIRLEGEPDPFLKELDKYRNV